MIDWTTITGFQWDEANATKSHDKHGIGCLEAESVFLATDLRILEDLKHSSPAESRWHAFGNSSQARPLSITFTIRPPLIRIISARRMNPVKGNPMATRKTHTLQVPTETTDSTDHLDLSKAVRVSLPNLKLSTETISLRMPAALLETIKIEANKRDVPYQSLIKMTLADHFQHHPADS